MNNYKLAAGVEDDLNAIWDYIAQDNIDAADKWIARLFEAFATLRASPGMGHKRTDLTQAAVLFWPVSNYLILYRAQPGGVEIIAVTQGSRDIPTFPQKHSK